MSRPGRGTPRLYRGRGLSVGLGRVLHHDDAARPCEVQQRIHVDHLPVEMDGHDGPGSRRDGRLDLRDVHEQRVRAHVDEDGPGAERADGLGGGDEREGDGDHFVSLANSDRLEGERQRVGSVGHADAVRGAAERGEVSLECRDLLAEDERCTRQHSGDGFVDLGTDREVLRLQIDQGDGRGGLGGLVPSSRRGETPPRRYRFTLDRLSRAYRRRPAPRPRPPCGRGCPPPRSPGERRA